MAYKPLRLPSLGASKPGAISRAWMVQSAPQAGMCWPSEPASSGGNCLPYVAVKGGRRAPRCCSFPVGHQRHASLIARKISEMC